MGRRSNIYRVANQCHGDGAIAASLYASRSEKRNGWGLGAVGFGAELVTSSVETGGLVPAGDGVVAVAYRMATPRRLQSINRRRRLAEGGIIASHQAVAARNSGLRITEDGALQRNAWWLETAGTVCISFTRRGEYTHATVEVSGVVC
jgi:hypothetical protein